MNEIAKQRIKDNLDKAIEREKLSIKEAAAVLGIATPPYVSMMRNPDTWKSCSIHAWDAALVWVNSGQGLREYGEKHGKVLCEKPDVKKMLDSIEIKKSDPVERVPEPKPDVIVPRKPNSVPKTDVSVPKEAVLEPKPAHKKLSVGEMVDMLLEEKQSLQTKIDAIDVLLKFYIS